MKRSYQKYLLLFTSFSLIILFQNCDGYQSAINEGSVLPSLEARNIWTANKILASDHDMIFYVNPSIFSKNSSYTWFYELNGTGSGCSLTQFEEYINATVVNCINPGVLHITLNVIDEELNSEKICNCSPLCLT